MALACNEKHAFSRTNNLKHIISGRVKNYVALIVIFWTIYLQVYRKTVGNPPLVANLFLFFYVRYIMLSFLIIIKLMLFKHLILPQYIYITNVILLILTIIVCGSAVAQW